eukprot:3346826-Amphidinium_carterae.1
MAEIAKMLCFPEFRSFGACNVSSVCYSFWVAHIIGYSSAQLSENSDKLRIPPIDPELLACVVLHWLEHPKLIARSLGEPATVRTSGVTLERFLRRRFTKRWFLKRPNRTNTKAVLKATVYQATVLKDCIEACKPEMCGQMASLVIVVSPLFAVPVVPVILEHGDMLATGACHLKVAAFDSRALPRIHSLCSSAFTLPLP